MPEGRAVIESILDKTMEGTGPHHTTPIFPCGIFQYKESINGKPGTPNYDLFRKALLSTTKRIYPNYANCDWSNQRSAKEYDVKVKTCVLNDLSQLDYSRFYNLLKERPDIASKYGLICDPKKVNIEVSNEEQPFEIFSTMGCRTANGADINFKNSFENNVRMLIESNGDEYYDDMMSACQKDGRGNICPATVIMPTLAMETVLENKDKGLSKNELFNKFIEKLTVKIEECKDALLDRYELICSQSPNAAKFMYENHTMSGYVPSEGIRSALRHGTLAIGQLGLSETLTILFGNDHSSNEVVYVDESDNKHYPMDYAKEIESLFLSKANKYKNKYKLNFGVYYTPAESLCYTAMTKFKERFGVIPGISDKEYFTNSIHVPVYKNVDCFNKIDIESELTGYSNAGCITYVELPSTAMHNIEAIEDIVTYAMKRDVPYFALNFPLDYCRNCHAQGDFNGVCPECGSKDIEELRRVTGYLSTSKTHFNYGKFCETDDRVKHTSKELNVYED